MITFRQLTIEDRDRIYALSKETGYITCESSFGVMYIWRKAYCIEIAFEDGFAIVKLQAEDGVECFYPPLGTGDLSGILEKMREYAAANNYPLRFLCAEKSFVEEIKKIYGEKAVVTERREHFDYIYNSSDLAYLVGKKYHGKRNHINKFESLFHYEVKPIANDNIATVLELNREWCRETGLCEDDMLGNERCAVANLLSSFPELHAKGIILYVEGRPAAYAAGTPLYPGSEIFTIHFEKALKQYDGAYSAINSFFAKILADDYKYLNREEDMGIEGLRKAKLSYYPEILLEKFEIDI